LYRQSGKGSRQKNLEKNAIKIFQRLILFSSGYDCTGPRSRLFFTLINIAAGERRRIHTAALRKLAQQDGNGQTLTMEPGKDRKSSSKSKEEEGIGKYCQRGHAEKLTGSAGRGISRAQGHRIRRGSK
jgi:hypothetical protein